VTSSFGKTKGFFCFSFNKRSPKDTFGKLSFLHTSFLENEMQINKNNYGTTVLMSKQVSPPKISSILKKLKSAQKAIYALFAQRPSIIAEILFQTGMICSVSNFWDQGTEPYPQESREINILLCQKSNGHLCGHAF